MNETTGKKSERQKQCEGYVRTDTGEWLVQIVDDDDRFGFYLCDDDQSWPGGFGAPGKSWQLVNEDDVREKIREQLRWILE